MRISDWSSDVCSSDLAIERRGITNAYDLVKVVPGLSVANAGNGATVVYTLRGIGFNASFLGATPTVSVYTDEVALPYPAMTGGVGLDLQRVEVLKGPQGTLFGQNSTEGADRKSKRLNSSP